VKRGGSKRVMRVTAAREGVSAHIGINVFSETGMLTLSELEDMKHRIASGIMKVLAETRYLNVDLSQMKVE
jgi:hypothetical protein